MRETCARELGGIYPTRPAPPRAPPHARPPPGSHHTPLTIPHTRAHSAALHTKWCIVVIPGREHKMLGCNFGALCLLSRPFIDGVRERKGVSSPPLSGAGSAGGRL
jgi:hypothetical protein